MLGNRTSIDFAATLQRHTKPTLQANLCKEAASSNHQQQNIIGQSSHSVDALHTTLGLAKVGLEETHIINSKQLNFSSGLTNKANRSSKHQQQNKTQQQFPA
jgi:hypothetical protein